MTKLVELTGLAAYGLTVMFANAIPVSGQGAVQYGGLIGLALYMVAQVYRQEKRMAKALDKKDEQLHAANARSERLAANFTDAIRDHGDAIKRLTEALCDRPCLVNDSRVDHKVKVQT